MKEFCFIAIEGMQEVRFSEEKGTLINCDGVPYFGKRVSSYSHITIDQEIDPGSPSYNHLLKNLSLHGRDYAADAFEIVSRVFPHDVNGEYGVFTVIYYRS